uniref:EB domain-containing protein n=1 Tax=Cacopsylla melanoneura TaxID=428564 RepID=A0A8D8S6V2_9HEMI
METTGFICLVHMLFVVRNIWALDSGGLRHGKSLNCKKDEDCIEHAVCSQLNLSNIVLQHQFCICDVGYVMFENKSRDVCLRVASQLGDPCIENIQCSATFGADTECRRPYSTAPSGFCQCKQGAKLVSGLCEMISKIGDSCQVSDNCPDNVYCDRSVCVCPYNHVANSDRTKCIKSSNLGEACNEDRNCLNTNSKCYEGRCRCSRNHVDSASGSMCLRLANNLLDQCKEDQQCLLVSPNAGCIHGLCECNLGYHAYNNICWTSIGLGEYCSDSRQCISNSNITALMHCHESRCSCIQASVEDKKNNECVQVPSSTLPQSVSLYSTVLCLLSVFIIR